MTPKKPVPNPDDIKIELISKCKHKNCYYKINYPMKMCDYLTMTGKPRETPISKCDKYISKKDAKAMGLTRRSAQNIVVGDD